MKAEYFKKKFYYIIILLIAIYFFTVIISVIYCSNINNFRRGKIAYIKVEGIISSSKDIIDQIKDAKEDDEINALVIRIDSPGGAVAPSQEIYNELIKLKKESSKKIIASMGNIAASGGYYISCAADKIMANPGTITGSIGVITRIPNFTKLFEKLGYNEQVIKSGEFKDMGSSSRELTIYERQIFQDMVQDIHQQFIETVSNERNINIEIVKKIADGRIFTGRQAHELGLIDYLGNFEDAIELATTLSGITGKPKVIPLKKENSFLDFFKEFLSQASFFNPFTTSPVKIYYLFS